MDGQYRTYKIKQRFHFLVVYLCFFYFPGVHSLLSQTQSDLQSWTDVELNYTYKQRHLFQNEFSYQTLLTGDNRWYSLNTTPVYEYSINPYFDFVSGTPLSYTVQQDGMNTFEVRGMIGARAYFTPNKRPQFRALIRFEERWSYDNSANNWDVGNRLRIRGELVYPLNKSTYFQDKVWYSITDAEVFFSTSKDISERFANRARFRIGLGYRLDYNWRFEAIYFCQVSRNTIEDHFNSVSNVIRLRLKYYFR